MVYKKFSELPYVSFPPPAHVHPPLIVFPARWYLCNNQWPTLALRYSPLVLTLDVEYSMGFDRCIMICIIQNSATAYTSSIFLSSLPWPLATTNYFMVSTVLPFPECRIVGITVCSLFKLAYVSLSNICLSFFSIFSRPNISSLFGAE